MFAPLGLMLNDMRRGGCDKRFGSNNSVQFPTSAINNKTSLVNIYSAKVVFSISDEINYRGRKEDEVSNFYTNIFHHMIETSSFRSS